MKIDENKIYRIRKLYKELLTTIPNIEVVKTVAIIFRLKKEIVEEIIEDLL